MKTAPESPTRPPFSFLGKKEAVIQTHYPPYRLPFLRLSWERRVLMLATTERLPCKLDIYDVKSNTTSALSDLINGVDRGAREQLLRNRR
jgi:hypothetical protein